MAKMGVIDWIAYILLVVGGLNWGLAVFDINLVTMIFGSVSEILVQVVYGLVGLSAVYAIYMAVTKLVK